MVLGLAEILILALVVMLIIAFVKNPKAGFTILGVLAGTVAVIFVLLMLLRTGAPVVPGAAINLSVFLFLPAVALIAGFIYLLIKYPKPALITLLVVGIAAFALIWFVVPPKMVSVTSSPHQQVTVQSRVPVDGLHIENGQSENVIRNDQELSAVWRDGIEDEFEVDVYPSQKASARQLARQIVKLATKLNDGQEPQWFELSLVSFDDTDVFSEFTKTIEKLKANPDNPILTSAKGLEGGVATIGLMLKNSTIGGKNHREVLSGTLQASASISGKRSEVTSKFDEKGWLENFSAYTNSHPDRRYVVVRSKSSCTNSEWAQKEAMTAATSVLASKLRDQGLSNFTVNPDDVETHGFIADKFTQSMAGSASNIWRQAILLDVSSDKMSHLADAKKNLLAQTTAAKAGHTRQMRQTWARMLLSLAGLITVICVVYLIVNVATKGYYTLVLRIVTVATIVIGAIVLLLVVLNYA